jgi:hypothetical protein
VSLPEYRGLPGTILTSVGFIALLRKIRPANITLLKISKLLARDGQTGLFFVFSIAKKKFDKTETRLKIDASFDKIQDRRFG